MTDEITISMQLHSEVKCKCGEKAVFFSECQTNQKWDSAVCKDCAYTQKNKEPRSSG